MMPKGKDTALAMCEVLKETGDRGYCGIVALAVATGDDPLFIQELVGAYGRQKGGGTTIGQLLDVLADYGLSFREDKHARSKGALTVASASKVASAGTWFALTRGHVAAIVNGDVHDWTAGRKHRIKHLVELVPYGTPGSYQKHDGQWKETGQ